MVVRPQRILWPTDFSSLALHGARYARALCELFEAQVHVIHVVAPPITPDVSVSLATDVPSEYMDVEVLETCKRRLEEVTAEQFPDMDVTRDVFYGHTWSGVCRYAEQSEIELIVVATHGRTGLRHVLIGSTAERIVQHAPCPVLVVKSAEKDFIAG